MVHRKLRKSLVGAVALAGIGSALVTGTAHAAVTEDIKLESWNGLCLDANDATPGASPVQAPCAHAHNLVYDITHNNMFVQGHPGDCINSYITAVLSIGPCSDGDSVMEPDDTKVNGSTDYERWRWVNEGTYAHANGSGQRVSMITNPGTSLAVYWTLLPQP